MSENERSRQGIMEGLRSAASATFRARAARAVGCMAVAAVALASCSNGQSTSTTTAKASASGSTNGPIIIGFATAQSGAFAAYDIPAVNGAKLAINDINAHGGIDGRKLEYVQADTQTDIAQARIAADQVLGKGAKFMMTTCDFDYGAPSALEAAKQDVVAMSSCAGSTKFRPAVFTPLAFSMSVATPAEGASMAQWAYKDKRARTGAVLIDGSIDQTKQDAAAFADAFTALGGKVVDTDSFEQTDQSISTQVSRLRALSPQPDVIFVSSYPPGGAKAIRQIRDAGINATILTDSNFDGTYWLGSVPGLTNMYHDAFVSLNGDDPSPQVNKVIAEYTQAYGKPPDTSLGFSSGYSVIQAFERAYAIAHTTEGRALVNALEMFQSVPLLVGPTTFNSQTHITLVRPLRIISVNNGKTRFLKMWTPTDVPNIK